MKITRKFTVAGRDPFASTTWARRSSRITNPDGSVVFEMKDAEMPEGWSQLAVDIMVSKYFRKAGVPQTENPYALPGTSPVVKGKDGKALLGPERSARQVIHRLAGCWRFWGEEHRYFDTPEDAQAFYDEIAFMMVHQMCAPNSPQWFNTGLHWAYGINGPAQGHCIVDPATGEVVLAPDAYSHPQPHACFIQSVTDDLVNAGGIMDLWVREARLFKYGSGTGTNFSGIRADGEKLSGGGKSSGLMSWLKIGDRAAGAIKSGGTTRRAAKMVCLDMDHPDIHDFINWKVREEIKVSALVEGMKHLSAAEKETAARLKLKLDYDFNGESYLTVSGQNSNNSVRVPSEFFDAVDAGAKWVTAFRTNPDIKREFDARALWKDLCFAAWRCADPGVQFDTTINEWHTCPGAGRINASNPCVTGDTLVATAEGYRRIKDLVGKSAEVINAKGERSYVDRIFPTGHKDVYELTTRSGYTLRLTADHKVLTANRGDVPAAELTVDDEVILKGAGFGGEFVPAAFGELLGAAVGDGCISHQPEQDFLSVTFGEGEAALADRLRGHMDECKRWLATDDRRGQRPSTVVQTQAGLRVGTSVERIVAEFARYATLDAGSEGKAFTDEVFGLDRASLSAILRGLFTADGTVANYGDKSQYVSLDSVSLGLLKQVQVLLLALGVKAKIYRDRRALGSTSAMLPDGKGGMAEYRVQQMHSLRISRSSRIVFEREVGFIAGSAKAARLAELNAGVVAYADRMTDRVASLTACGTEDVFDLTEPVTSHFVANGIVVHNCSEYMFLDNTACNLASLNVIKFYDREGRTFDIEGFEHGVDLWTVVLEISVLMAAFPSREIAELSYKYRTLGLGFANLGAMLMQAGIAYDSEQARAVCACLSAIMTGRSYRQSAVMAEQLGAFPGYAPERESMLRVVRNHRRAAYGVARDAGEWETLRIRPVPIDHDLVNDEGGGVAARIANAADLGAHARGAWDEALRLGEQHGYRNAQVTVIAPTGTIGLLMDCDTTGVEPDFALVKFKKLAGGGYFKIANESVRPALETLGYAPAQIADIMRSLLGTLDLDVPMPAGAGKAQAGQTLAQWLRGRGLSDEEILAVSRMLPGVFELKFAFGSWCFSDETLARLKIDPAKAKADPAWNLLRALGLKARDIDALNRLVCGTQTVEGAPHLKAEHLPVFDCASKCGATGTRFIAPEGHIRMMAASQPFITGAISKTINLPNGASVEDIERCYRMSWELGLKANALYRDGCKLSQPLSTKSEGSADAAIEGEVDEQGESEARVEVATQAAGVAAAVAASDAGRAEELERAIIHRPMRRRLPDTRSSITHKFNVAGHEGYLTVGIYEDGMPGELFITMAKEGSTIGGLMDSLGTATSVALQYGVPLESLVKKFTHQRFEPAGMTANRDIPFAKSLVDYIFRWLGIQFIEGYREANTPNRSGAGSGSSGAANGAGHGSPAHDDHEHDARNGMGNGTSGAHGAAGRSANAKGAHAAQGTVSRLAGVKAMSPVVARALEARPAGKGAGARAEAMSMTLSIANESAGDAPPCDVCGTITVRSGTCYKCLNCGASLGCS